MNPAMLNDIDSQLRKDWTAFVDVWRNTKDHWRDARCRQFEQEDLQPLPGVVSRTCAAIAEFRDFASRVSTELRDDDEHEFFV